MEKVKKLSKEYKSLAKNICFWCKHKGLDTIVDKDLWIFYCSNCRRIIIINIVFQKILGTIKI